MTDPHLATVRQMNDKRPKWLGLPDIAKLIGCHASNHSTGGANFSAIRLWPGVIDVFRYMRRGRRFEPGHPSCDLGFVSPIGRCVIRFVHAQVILIDVAA